MNIVRPIYMSGRDLMNQTCFMCIIHKSHFLHSESRIIKYISRKDGSWLESHKGSDTVRNFEVINNLYS